MLANNMLSERLLGYFMGLCEASSIHYQEGGATVSYEFRSAAPYPQPAGMRIYHESSGRAQQLELPTAEERNLANFLSKMLGFYSTDESALFRCKNLVRNILSLLREQLGFSYVTCEVTFDKNDLSADAILILATQEHGCFHIITLEWQVD